MAFLLGFVLGAIAIVTAFAALIHKASCQYEKENPERHQAFKKEFLRFEAWTKHSKKKK